MEANKTTCNTCGKVEFWHGYKTRSLKDQRRDFCRNCGGSDIKIEPDTETELGKMYDEQAQFAAGIIAELITGMMAKKKKDDQ